MLRSAASTLIFSSLPITSISSRLSAVFSRRCSFRAPHCATIKQSATMNQTNLAFIDIGANLLDDMFQGNYHGSDKSYHPPDLDAVLQRSWDAGVQKIIITAGNLEEAKAALALARSHERLFTTLGVHPTRCSEFETYPEGPDAYMAALKEVLFDGTRDGKIVAIGECGLDYDRLQFCDAETQRRWFAAQFELAKISNLPMFLHLRAAADDFLEIVRRHVEDFPAGVVHSFDGTASELENVLKIEKLDIGVNGCSLKTEENLSVAKLIPIERLHFETDAPWCDIRATHAGASFVNMKLPVKDKKKHDVDCLVKGRNEPCNIKQVFEVVSRVKLSIATDAVTTEENKDEAAAMAATAAEKLCSTVYNNSLSMFFPKC